MSNGINFVRYLPDPNDKEEMDEMVIIQAKLAIEDYFSLVNELKEKIKDYEGALNKIEEAERMSYSIGMSFGEYARRVLERWK